VVDGDANIKMSFRVTKKTNHIFLKLSLVYIVCNMIAVTIVFVDNIHRGVFFLFQTVLFLSKTQRFGNWTLSPSSV
jgi:hypothetical protein